MLSTTLRTAMLVSLFPALVFAPAARASTPIVFAEQDWSTTRAGVPPRYGDHDNGPRKLVDLVIRELDPREGDIVVDIGAGDGWWSEKVAAKIGADGVVFAAEIKQDLVDKINLKYGDLTNLKPTLVETDNLNLEDDTLDLAFFVKVYHHVDKREDYWKHLQKVVKPTGRVVVVDRHPIVPNAEPVHSMAPATLFEEARKGGWFPVRYEQLPRSGYYVAVFVQQQIFQSP